MTTLYEVLGVEPDADLAQIKLAYRRLARQAHPDKGGNVEDFKKIEEAYRILKDPESRALYDETGQTKKKDPIDDQVFSAVSQIAMSHMQQNSFAVMDYVSMTIKTIDENMRKAEADLVSIKTIIPRIERLIELMEGDVMLAPLNSQLDRFNGQVRSIESAKVIHDRAIEVLGRCKYKGVKTITMDNFSGTTFYGNSTGTSWS